VGELAARLNLSRAMGIDADLEETMVRNRIALPLEESLWPLYGNGCVLAAQADERVPARSGAPHRHWI